MICIAIGLGVLGAIAFKRARHCHRGGYGWYGPWGGHHHHHRRHGRRAFFVDRALDYLDATPAQERFIVGELDKLTDRVHSAKTGLRETRSDLAAALRSTELDDAALGAVLGRVDAAGTEVRAAGIDALRAVHGVLDDKQRTKLADLLDASRSWWRTGPYR